MLQCRIPRHGKGFAVDAQTAATKGTPGDRLRSLKYLIAACKVYIEEEPVHLVGMPFPCGPKQGAGSSFVEKRTGYRDKKRET